MKSFKLLLTSLCFSMLFILGCQKELSQVPGGPQLPNFDNAPNITTNITGRIVDENNAPVEGAMIKVGNANALTNVNGEFALKSVHVYDDATFVQASMQGYFTGSRTIVSKQGGNHYVEIKLLPKTIAGTIDMATGGTVTLANGTAVTLPASSVVVASSNAPYSGVVSVALAWIDFTSDDLVREMPGDLRGIRANNAQVGLQSFGMVAVELTGNAGEKLQIAAEKKATVKFFLPASSLAEAPATIPLWHFDDKAGLWKEEGEATKTGNFYQGEVSHFSFWNCDAPFPLVNFTASIKDANGNPLIHQLVKIKRLNSNGFSHGYTDSTGTVKGKLPSNEPLELQVLNQCFTAIHSENIGPFSSAASINVTVTNTGQQTAIISGTALNCNAQPLANGFADVVVGFRTYRTTVTNGSFSLQISLCSGNQNATLVVVDPATSQQGTANLTLSAGNNNAGTITACGTSITEFINLTVDGNTHSFIPPGDSVMAWYGTQTNVTNIQAARFNAGSQNFMSLMFTGNSLGTTPIVEFMVTIPNASGNMIPASPIQVNITEYGNAGGFIAGNFSGTIDDNGVSRSVQCNFRVRRMY